MANSFSQFQTDIVRVINKDKTKISIDFKVSLNLAKTDVFATTIDINEGDFIERELPNGHREMYEITNVLFNPKFMTINEHYELKLKKIG